VWTSNGKKGAARLMILVACLLPVFAGQLADFPNPAVLRADSYPPVRQELKFAAAGSPARAADKPSENKASDFTLTSLDGSRVTLSNYRGKKGVVLVFFATWCVNCMREVPEIKKFALVAQKANIEVLAVNFKQRKNIVEKFHKAQEINYRIVLDEDGAVTLDKYGIKGLPHIVGVDLKGETIYRGEDLPVNRTEFIEKLIQGP
jgi:peroxiredoxin